MSCLCLALDNHDIMKEQGARHFTFDCAIETQRMV